MPSRRPQTATSTSSSSRRDAAPPPLSAATSATTTKAGPQTGSITDASRSTRLRTQVARISRATAAHASGNALPGPSNTFELPQERGLIIGTPLAPEARLSEQDLHVSDPPLREARLAVGQVQGPDPAEALVITEFGQCHCVLQEPRSPDPQRLHVSVGQIVQIEDLQIGAARQGAGEHGQRRQRAAGEDVLLDERARRFLDGVGAVIDGDRLQEHCSVRLEQLRAVSEEGSEPAPADRLDHLDRRELVVTAVQVAKV